MGKLTLHAKIEIGLATALLLGSCNSAPSYSADEAYDLADAARANSNDALDRYSDLEGRVSELESKTRLNEVNIDTLFSNSAKDRDTANDNAQITNRALDRLNAIEARLGM